MPVPKRKRSRSRRDKRFANKGLKAPALSNCKNCQSSLLSHMACKECGFYKGKQVIGSRSERMLLRAEKKSKSAQAASEQAVSAEPTSTE